MKIIYTQDGEVTNVLVDISEDTAKFICAQYNAANKVEGRVYSVEEDE